jgi:hypothetical protein
MDENQISGSSKRQGPQVFGPDDRGEEKTEPVAESRASTMLTAS